VAAVVAAPVESAKKAYESIKETLVGPSEPVEEKSAGGGGGGGKRAKVLFDYEATEDNELALREGEILVELEMVDEGWWSAKGEKGDVGLVSSRTSSLFPSRRDEGTKSFEEKWTDTKLTLSFSLSLAVPSQLRRAPRGRRGRSSSSSSPRCSLTSSPSCHSGA